MQLGNKEEEEDVYKFMKIKEKKIRELEHISCSKEEKERVLTWKKDEVKRWISILMAHSIWNMWEVQWSKNQISKLNTNLALGWRKIDH